MATNRRRANGRHLSVVASDPATPASGDPIRVGQIGGIATTDERADGTVSADFNGVYLVNVDDDAATGIAPGAKLYYQDAATGSPATHVNNNSTTPEAFFGYALGTLATNATGEIEVLIDRGAVS